jgi:hypothetical protein
MRRLMVLMLLTLAVTGTVSGRETAVAEPTTVDDKGAVVMTVPETTPEFEEIFDVLEDGTIIVTRVEVSTEPVTPSMLACAQPAPTLVEPADNAQLDTLIPDYQWQQVAAEVFRYRFQLSRQPDFSVLDENPIFRTSNPSPGSTMSAFSRSNLLPNTTYYWRVASICEDTDEMGAFSAPFSFRTALPGGTILPAPILLAPDDGATVTSTNVTFSLATVVGAVKYQYRFYRSEDDEWDEWFRFIMTAHTSTVSSFDPEESYYWRVAAVNSYAVGEPSTQYAFMTVEPLKLFLPAIIK